MIDISESDDQQNVSVYASSFGAGDNDAIYVLNLILRTGQISQVHCHTGAENPLFLILLRDKNFLYSRHARGEFEGGNVSEVSAYQIDSETGQLDVGAQ